MLSLRAVGKTPELTEWMFGILADDISEVKEAWPEAHWVGVEEARHGRKFVVVTVPLDALPEAVIMFLKELAERNQDEWLQWNKPRLVAGLVLPPKEEGGRGCK